MPDTIMYDNLFSHLSSPGCFFNNLNDNGHCYWFIKVIISEFEQYVILLSKRLLHENANTIDSDYSNT